MDDVLVKCPNCGIKDLDLRAYTSMMVLSNTQALFTVYCNHCNQTVSTVANIPPVLYPDVYQAAAEVDAGMGRQGRITLWALLPRAHPCVLAMMASRIAFVAPFSW